MRSELDLGVVIGNFKNRRGNRHHDFISPLWQAGHDAHERVCRTNPDRVKLVEGLCCSKDLLRRYGGMNGRTRSRHRTATEVSTQAETHEPLESHQMKVTKCGVSSSAHIVCCLHLSQTVYDPIIRDLYLSALQALIRDMLLPCRMVSGFQMQ